MGSSLVQMMACRQLGVEPFSETMMGYIQFDHSWGQIPAQYQLIKYIFLKERHLKMSSAIWRPFSPALNVTGQVVWVYLLSLSRLPAFLLIYHRPVSSFPINNQRVNRRVLVEKGLTRGHSHYLSFSSDKPCIQNETSCAIQAKFRQHYSSHFSPIPHIISHHITSHITPHHTSAYLTIHIFQCNQTAAPPAAVSPARAHRCDETHSFTLLYSYIGPPQQQT